MDKSSTEELEKQIEQNAEQINKLIANKAAKESEIDELKIKINAEKREKAKDFLIKRIAIRKKYINDTNLQIETLKNLNKKLSLEVQKTKRLKEALLKSERLKKEEEEREREEILMRQDVVDDKNNLSKSEPLKPMSSINYQDEDDNE